MTPKGKRCLWLLLLIPICLLLWWIYTHRSAQTTDRASAPVNDRVRPTDTHQAALPAKFVPVLSYMPAREVKLDEHYQGSEYQLMGTVSSESGEILLGATVSLHSAGPRKPRYEWPPPVASDTCDSEGRYSIRLATPMSNAVIAVRKEGFATLEDFQPMAFPGTVVKNYRMKWAPACVEGNVMDQEGKPISGAAISTAVDNVNYGGELDLSHLAVFGHSNNAGKFEVFGLPADRVHVGASAVGFQKASTTITLRSGPCARAEFRLQAAQTIILKVRNRRGAGIDEAFVQSTIVSARSD